jgi:ABC-2 type transport system ATP-binding protein
MLGELEQVSDWLLIIDRGRLVYAGDAAGVASHAAPELVVAPLDDDHLARLVDVVRGEGLAASRDGGQLVVSVDGHEPRALAGALNHRAAAAGIVLAELHVRRPSLEANYFRLLEGENR